VQAFIPLAAPGAKLFNISSCLAHLASVAPVEDVFAYAVTKLASTRMFDFVAAENPELHIVNVHPGVTDTEINANTDVKGVDEGTSAILHMIMAMIRRYVSSYNPATSNIMFPQLLTLLIRSS
jgi:NAD(P)-dependent dehydrogenase (short-subunit alcohol dehydrogenase family)